MDICEVTIKRKYLTNFIGNDEFEDIIGYFDKEGMEEFQSRLKIKVNLNWDNIVAQTYYDTTYEFGIGDILHTITCKRRKINRSNPIIDKWLNETK